MSATHDGDRIVLEQVSLRYRLARQRVSSVKEYAVHWLKGTLVYEEFWALQGVSLRVGSGECLGIVGRNGAGKSSLVKVISGLLEPTSGTRRARGSLAPILSLGAGFDFDLTGIENIYLSGLLMGYTRREVDAQLDDIVAFSELHRFIDSPLRSYSTGMVARLGFAVATAWIPDILILDEVLSVGDAEFLQKCGTRLQDFLAADTTLLLISHNPDAILAMCSRCIWIDGGRLQADGEPGEVLDRYHASSARPGGP